MSGQSHTECMPLRFILSFPYFKLHLEVSLCLSFPEFYLPPFTGFPSGGGGKPSDLWPQMGTTLKDISHILGFPLAVMEMQVAFMFIHSKNEARVFCFRYRKCLELLPDPECSQRSGFLC